MPLTQMQLGVHGTLCCCSTCGKRKVIGYSAVISAIDSNSLQSGSRAGKQYQAVLA